MTTTEFMGFPKMSRFSREVYVLEKIDGTNAQILIEQDGTFLCGSRTRWIVPGDDNFGFAKWAHENKDELIKLGPGKHFGEWWGLGIQRNYGLKERRFSLFNASRWADPHSDPANLTTQVLAPACCHVVPILWRGNMDDMPLMAIMAKLAVAGSEAAPGFMDPEGVVIFHTASNIGFKKTIKDDNKRKTQ